LLPPRHPKAIFFLTTALSSPKTVHLSENKARNKTILVPEIFANFADFEVAILTG
jgi:hypothetical protein